ncbi:hypothetical protein [Clostridium sp. OF09-36]|uniref:hypothetical protein n=1 Tax=Clostridium sp. OF09-36 TaxID=2292310 RepID=UPI001FAA6496|nr:hypothetical protein [Clostridium sp. OF09-36]
MKHWTHLLMKTRLSLEKENMIWNMTGSFFYAFASMVLSFLVLRIAGEEQGGIFSFGFSTVGQQMFLLAYFGIRPFHITDGANQYRFGDYLHHRYGTCFLALLLGAGYLAVTGYSWQKVQIIFLLIAYKVIDGFADVYESEFQRQGCLYLTGRSNTFRTILSVGVFLVTLCSGAGLFAACVAAVLGQIAGVVLFDIVVLKELPKVDYNWSGTQARALTASAILLFVSVFLDFYIFSAAKYAIDAHLGDAASGYFNVIFMPTSVINLAAGFVIRPYLTYLTDCWNAHRFSDFRKAAHDHGSDRWSDGSGGRRDRGAWKAGACASGMAAWCGIQRKADSTLARLCHDRAGRRFLCSFKSLLLCAGHFAEAEADLWHLCGAHGTGGSPGSEDDGGIWDSGRGSSLSGADGHHGSRICGWRLDRNQEGNEGGAS